MFVIYHWTVNARAKNHVQIEVNLYDQITSIKRYSPVSYSLLTNLTNIHPITIFWSVNLIDDQKTNPKQLQNALREFDFLQHIDRTLPSTPLSNRIPTTTTPATAEPMPQQRPHIRISPDTYHRALFSMPPVILMGPGGNNGSMPVSPIVEMPPSPAPSDKMFIEYPEDGFVEVRIDKNFPIFFFNNFLVVDFYLGDQ